MKQRSFTALVFGGVLASATPALAGPADNYISKLDGNWRGGGVLTTPDGKKVKLRCATKNSLSDGQQRLSMNGRCASSQGKASLRGRLRTTDDGAQFTSVSFTIAGRGRYSSARLNGNTLTLNGTGKVDGGRTVSLRSVIRGGGNRYSITLFDNDGGSWNDRGTLTFRR